MWFKDRNTKEMETKESNLYEEKADTISTEKNI